MDNREDVAFLESEEGAKAIVSLHVDGILQYLSKKNYFKEKAPASTNLLVGAQGFL